jgi:hypothetical protein
MSILQGKHQAALAPATTKAAIAATITASFGRAARGAKRTPPAARSEWLGTILLRTITIDSLFGSAQ